jgi:hypothetical protein
MLTGQSLLKNLSYTISTKIEKGKLKYELM